MRGFYTLVTVCAIYAVGAHVLIGGDYEAVVDRATAQQLQAYNACKLAGSRAGGMGLGFGSSRRKTKGSSKLGCTNSQC